MKNIFRLIGFLCLVVASIFSLINLDMRTYMILY